MTLPSRLSATLGIAITGLLALAQETHWSHEVKQAVLIVGGLALAWLVHPGEAGATAGEGPLETARRPDGALPLEPPSP